MTADQQSSDTRLSSVSWSYKNTVLTLCVLSFFSTMVARLVVSPVVPAITATYGVSHGVIGVALTGMWVAYALSHYPSGVLGDRLGERRVVLGAVGLTAVGGLALSVAPSFPTFAAFAVVLGAAAGLYYPAGASLLSKRFTNVGQAMGFHISGASLAGLITPVAVTIIALEAGWRAGLLLAPVIAIPVWILFAWRVRPRSVSEGTETSQRGLDPLAVVATLRRPVMAYTVVLAFIQTFVFSATLSFLPTFLTAYHRTGPVTASVLFSLFFIVLGIAQPSAGRLSDRAGRDTTAALAFGLGAVGYAVLVVGGPLPVLVVGVALAGAGMSCVVPLESKFMDNIAVGDRGTDFGVVRMTYVLLGASGSAVTGTVSDISGWETAFAVFVGLLVLAVLLIGLNQKSVRL